MKALREQARKVTFEEYDVGGTWGKRWKTYLAGQLVPGVEIHSTGFRFTKVVGHPKLGRSTGEVETTKALVQMQIARDSLRA